MSIFKRTILRIAVLLLCFGALFGILVLNGSISIGATVDGVYSLYFFSGLKLFASILFVLCLAVHIIANVKPMLISFGVRKLSIVQMQDGAIRHTLRDIPERRS